MYAQGKMPESIKTTETHQRTHKVTLSVLEAHNALAQRAMEIAGITPELNDARASVYVWRPAQTGPNSDLVYEVTIIEDLSKPAITDFAPPNIEEIVRLNPPATPGLGGGWRGTNPHNWPMPAGDDLALVVVQAKSRTLKEPTSFEMSSPINTTATSSRENVDAIERMKEEQPALLKAMDINARYSEIKTGIPRDLAMEDLMKRVNKIHDVLLHGKGHNIVLSRGEVDTALEYINAHN